MGSAGKVAMSSRQITQFVGVLLFIRDPRARSKAILRRGRNGCACCGGFRFPSTLHHIGFQILGARCGIRERDYNNKGVDVAKDDRMKIILIGKYEAKATHRTVITCCGAFGDDGSLFVEYQLWLLCCVGFGFI